MFSLFLFYRDENWETQVCDIADLLDPLGSFCQNGDNKDAFGLISIDPPWGLFGNGSSMNKSDRRWDDETIRKLSRGAYKVFFFFFFFFFFF